MNTAIPIFLASDDRYAPFVATTIASICYNASSVIKIYILNDGISFFHKKMIALLADTFNNVSIDFIQVDAHRRFADINLPAWLPSHSSLSRILIPSLVSGLDKAIYSDVDVIFLGDVTEIYEHDLSGYALGAVYHAYFDEIPYQDNCVLARMDIKEGHKYFYSGNLLFDCKKWTSLNIVQNVLNIAEQYRTRLTMPDQCILNKYFEGNNFKLLDNKFCLTTRDCQYLSRTNTDEYHRLARDVVIRHFETPRKPWLVDMFSENYPIDHFEEFWFFAKMTPFYSELQQRFIENMAQDTIPPDMSVNPKKRKQTTLSLLRKNVQQRKTDINTGTISA